MRIECRLRIKYNITTKHFVIQHQRGNPNWPLWLKTHCSTGEKISNAEAAARVTSSNWNIYSQHQPLEHNRVGNPRFAVYIFTYLYTYLHIFTYIYIFIYLHMYTYLHIYIYTYTYIYFHIFIYFQIFSDIHIYLHILTCTNHRCTYIYIYLHMFTYISMFTYTYIYWHMRTYTFISLTSTFFSHMGLAVAEVYLCKWHWHLCKSRKLGCLWGISFARSLAYIPWRGLRGIWTCQ